MKWPKINTILLFVVKTNCFSNINEKKKKYSDLAKEYKL